jgi:hypothetical protein
MSTKDRKAQRPSAVSTIENEATRKEQVYFKAPRAPLVNMSDLASTYEVTVDKKKLEQLLLEYKREKYTDVHTHPIVRITGKFGPDAMESCLPSDQDFYSFIDDTKRKTMVIASRGGSGSVYACVFIRKKKTEAREVRKSRVEDYSSRHFDYAMALSVSDLERLSKRYNLQYKVLRVRNTPVEDYSV